MRTLILSSIFALSFAAEANAAPGADDSARVGAVGGATVYDFEDDDVDGELLSPQGANVSSRARSKHASLITVRPHFINEMVKMANDI